MSRFKAGDIITIKENVELDSSWHLDQYKVSIIESIGGQQYTVIFNSGAIFSPTIAYIDKYFKYHPTHYLKNIPIYKDLIECEI